MKLYKSLALLLCAASLSTGFTSCKDSFLDEEDVRVRNTDHFKTQEGLDDLAAGAYIIFRFNYQYTWGSQLNEAGTDECTSGVNGQPADSYSATFNTQNADVNTLWNDMYALVEYANILLKNVPEYYDKSNANYNTRLGEAYFFRGWAYYMLTSQIGGVPLKLYPSSSVETYFTRNTEGECWAQVINDLQEAYNLLPATAPARGRAYKDAAAHFLAKASLWRASERCDAFNASTKATDLDNVIKYGKEVIDHHPLASNFNELWANTDVNSAVDNLPEIVFSAQFNQTATTRDRFMNQQFLYFAQQYFNMPGFVRDISGGREFNYCRPTLYTYEVFDRVNDSRFWKSFITVYNCNNPSTAPKWTQEDADAGYLPAGAVVGEPRFKGGEVGMKYIMNNISDQRFSAHMENGAIGVQSALKDGKLVPANVYVLYFKDDARNWNVFEGVNQGNNIHNQRNKGLTPTKYRDGSREAVASQFGGMDGIIARSAEDYLMVAEAYVRKNDYTNALVYINGLRQRAGYAAGEDRSFHIDGGVAYRTNPKGNGIAGEWASYSDTNTYYESNNIAETTASTKDKMTFASYTDCYNNAVDKLIIDQLGLQSEYDKMLAFILNERTRELYAEFVRWEDLARTKTLESRYKAFNYSQSVWPGQFNASKHYYRPVPQSFLDAITNESGKGLTNEEKQAMQNPGW